MRNVTRAGRCGEPATDELDDKFKGLIINTCEIRTHTDNIQQLFNNCTKLENRNSITSKNDLRLNIKALLSSI